MKDPTRNRSRSYKRTGAALRVRRCVEPSDPVAR